jgi:glycosyltransferase involved in cell wall biosynthesis
MVIFYDHQIFSWQRFGGISRYFYEIISRLSRQSDIEISLFQGFHINKYGLSAFRGNYKYYQGCKRPALPKTTKVMNFVNDRFFNLLAPMGSVDVYHQTYYMVLKPDFGGKRVVTVHDMIHEMYPQYFAGDRVTAHKKESVRRADGIICISQSTKNDLMNYFGCSEDKVKVIYHGNSLQIKVTSPPLVAVPYILYVGQRKGHKNFELLLTAYARLRQVNAEFSLVCFGGEKLSSEERNKIAELGLSNRVRYYEGPDELLANLYTHAAVFIYPSLYEGFGIPPLEAMHCGCPVLSSNTSSLPEVVGDAGLYFDPSDKDELMHKLELVLSDVDMRAGLVKAGYQQVKKFSWDSCSKETLQFYQELRG